MALVVVEPETEGLGVMLAELVKGNLERTPDAARLLHKRGTVNIHATDAEIEVGLRFTGAGLEVGHPVTKPDLSISTTSDVLMSLTSVPLRFGLPDNFTAEGRHVTKMLFNGKLKVRGMVRHLGLMSRLNRLLSVL